MERKKFDTILRKMNQVCLEINAENDSKDSNNKISYEVLQLSDLRDDFDIMHKIAHFYNDNWTGNRDFMHIPNLLQVSQNCRNYPIIIAREKGKKEIIGISTIKYSENDENNYDVYFPEDGAKFFSVTGILINKDSKVRGVGKKIYEIAVRGSYEYEKEYPGTRLMCVVDCRNKHSLEALAVAVENINKNSKVGVGKELPANIMGYYEVKDTRGSELLEAPTLILEVGLTPDEEIQDLTKREELIYSRSGDRNLFENLTTTLRKKLRKYGIQEPQIGIDNDGDEQLQVLFYPLTNMRGCNIRDVKIEAGDTAAGNDRIPEDKIKIDGFIGPMPPVYEER